MATKTIISAENKPEATEIFAFVKSLDDEKRKAFEVFVDGARFMQSLMSSTQSPTAQNSV